MNMTTAQAINDVARVDYLRGYLNNVRLAVEEDGVPMLGYTLWSLYDNMEWNSAYSLRFGIVHVDCAKGDLTRYVKRSAQFYSDYILAARGLSPPTPKVEERGAAVERERDEEVKSWPRVHPRARGEHDRGLTSHQLGRGVRGPSSDREPFVTTALRCVDRLTAQIV